MNALYARSYRKDCTLRQRKSNRIAFDSRHMAFYRKMNIYKVKGDWNARVPLQLVLGPANAQSIAHSFSEGARSHFHANCRSMASFPINNSTN